MTEKQRPTTVISSLPDNGLPVVDAKDVTVVSPEQRLAGYIAEERILRGKWGVAIRPYTVFYNDGKHRADIELIANPQ